MITRQLLLLVIFSSLALGVHAQARQGTRATFQSVVQAGLVNGSKGSSFALQAITGLSFKGTFAGLGAGLDFYRFRSIPLFVDLRHQFGKDKRGVLLYGDLGYHFDWLTQKNKSEALYSDNPNYTGGIYYDAGIGYYFGFKKADAFILSAGYSYKQINNTSSTTVCPFDGSCTEDRQTYTYSMPRLVIKAGWRF